MKEAKEIYSNIPDSLCAWTTMAAVCELQGRRGFGVHENNSTNFKLHMVFNKFNDVLFYILVMFPNVN